MCEEDNPTSYFVSTKKMLMSNYFHSPDERKEFN